MIRACIFDLGGTLIDKYSLSPLYSLHKAFHKYNIPITKSLIADDMGLKKQEHIETILEKPNVKPMWYRGTSDIPKCVITDCILREFNRVQTKSLETCDLIENSVFIVNRLQKMGIKVGITTGFNYEHTMIVNNIFEEHNIFLDSIVSSDCVDNSRPHPDMIYKNMRNLDITNPKEIIKIDDTNVGIQEGLNARCFTIGVPRWSINMNMYGENEGEEDFNTIMEKLKHSKKQLQNCHYLIDDLKSIPTIVLNINALHKRNKKRNSYDLIRSFPGHGGI
jgi:phosphonoacetaldehyde hydrolase